MTKQYFTRDKNGELIKYHEAPGMDEVHLPNDGTTIEDVKHLLTTDENEMPIPTDNWNGFIGKVLGGSFAGLVRTIVGAVVTIYIIVTSVQKLSDKLDNAAKDSHSALLAIDSLRTTNADYKRTIRPMVYKDHTVLMRHFPKDPEFQSAAWTEQGESGN